MTEQRVALVLNGGVSLAVWMAGVVYEIDLLRRATGLPGDGEGLDGEVMSKWRELSGADNGDGRKVVVDVIAGTSAGGLNGAMLAKAIAQGGTLNPTNTSPPWLKKMWLEAASLAGDALLASDPAGPASLLSGKYFTETIENRLGQLTGASARGRMSLFVTATAMDPSDRSYVDGYGGTFTVPDHRRVYRFEWSDERLKYVPGKWRPGEPESGFDTDEVDHFTDCAALSLAARASASFPVAFPAVRESLELAARRMLSASSNGQAWLLDGGILDNAPFTPVLEAIGRQPLKGDARRTLIYVVPSDGGSTPALIDPEKGGPTWPQVAAASFSFPREVDFRADIEQLEGLVRDADAAWSDADQLFACLLDDPASRAAHTDAAIQLMPTYRKARAAGGIREAREIAAKKDPTVSLAVRAALSPAELESILDTDPRWLPPPSAENTVLVEPAAATWWWGMTPAYNTVRMMLQWLRDHLVQDPDDQALIDAVTEVDLQLRRITAVRETLQEQLFGLPQVAGYAELARFLNAVMDNIHLREVLATLVNKAVDAFAAVMPDRDSTAVLRSALAVEVINKALHARLPQKPHAPFDLLRLGPDIDTPVLVDPPKAGTSEHGYASSTMAGELGGRKLYGTQIYHFGAFGQEDWRRWDWLWGRLDAVAHLGRAIGRDRGMDDEAITEWITETQRRILKAENWKRKKVKRQLKLMATLDTSGLLNIMRSNDRGRASLQLLGDHSTTLFDNLNKPKWTLVGQWLRCLAQRENSEPVSGLRKVVRWFTHPLRTAAWNWLSQAAPSAVVTPGFARQWPYWTGISILIPLIAVPIILGVHGAVWAAGLAVASVLLGAAVTAVAVLGWLQHKSDALGKKIKPGTGT